MQLFVTSVRFPSLSIDSPYSFTKNSEKSCHVRPTNDGGVENRRLGGSVCGAGGAVGLIDGGAENRRLGGSVCVEGGGGGAVGLVPCTQRPGTLLLLLDRYICSSSFLKWCVVDVEDIEGNYASAQSSEPVSGELRSGQTRGASFLWGVTAGV
jgi:hypothetical protein